MKLRYPKTYEEHIELKADYDALLSSNDAIPSLKENALDERVTPRWHMKALPLFRNHPLEVQRLARVNLDNLLIKHAPKLNSRPKGKKRNFYYGILVATSVIMAKRQLGLCRSWSEIAPKAISSRNKRSSYRTFLGMQEPLNRDKSLPIGQSLIEARIRRKAKANLALALHEGHGSIPVNQVIQGGENG